MTAAVLRTLRSPAQDSMSTSSIYREAHVGWYLNARCSRVCGRLRYSTPEPVNDPPIDHRMAPSLGYTCWSRYPTTTAVLDEDTSIAGDTHAAHLAGLREWEFALLQACERRSPLRLGTHSCSSRSNGKPIPSGPHRLATVPPCHTRLVLLYVDEQMQQIQVTVWANTLGEVERNEPSKAQQGLV